MNFSEWREVELESVISFNPKETLKKGKIAKKVAMDKLDTFNRKIQGYEECEFKGGTKFRNGDTLLARITPCLENGKTAQVSILDKDEVGFGSTEFIVMRGIQGITYNDYIYYLAISPEFRNIAIKSMTGTSGRQRVQGDVLQRSKINLPSLQEQKAIANILSSLDEKIELNNQMNKTLEEMAQALFKRWFVDFEFPNENGEPYKSSGGEMVDSELGMIPKGWEVTTFGEVGDIVAGGTPSTKNEEYYDGDIPWITPRDLSGYTKKFIAKGERSITELGLQKSSAKLMPANSVLFSSRAPIGYVVIAKGEVCTNQGFKSIVCKEKKVPYNYIYWLLKTEKEKIELVASGSTFKEVSGKTMKEYKVILPQKMLLDKFKDITGGFDRLIIKNEDELDRLQEIRDTLLPKLMSGEIRVTNLQN